MAGTSRAFGALTRRLGRWLGAVRDRLAARRAGLLARAAVLAATPPVPLATGDAEAAAALAAGSVRLAGTTVAIGGRSPWAVSAGDAAWVAALHGFDWLDDAVVASRADRLRLRGWVFDWLRRHGTGSGPGWRPGLAGRRLMRLAPAAATMLERASPAESRALRRALRVHLAFLRARHGAAETLAERLDAATGLVLGALAVEGAGRSLRRGRAALGRLAAAVAPDGGVPGRDLSAQVQLFVHLAWTAHAMAAAGHTPTPAHTAALARLGPAVRALRLGDGGLPRFHGACLTVPGLAPEALDMAFALAGAQARGPRRDAAMGYLRLSAGRSTVILDAAPPPRESTAGAASTLALEFSVGRVRVFGSIGPGARLGGEWAVAARATAAHSAVEIAGASAARIAPDDAAARVLGRPVVAGPSAVSAERTDDLDGLWLRAEHDGYLARFGLVVARRLHLSRDGCDFRGEDSVSCPTPAARAAFGKAAVNGGVPFCVRFHLAPDVEAEPFLGGRGVRLRLPDGGFWVMRCSGGAVQIVDSVWLDGLSRRAEPSRQIVITARAEGFFGRVQWALSRADSAAAALREASGRVPA